MNGFQLYKELRKIDSKVKVCFLTASEMFYEEYRKNEVAEEEEEEDIVALDKDLFLQKPLSNQDLLQQVNKIIMGH